MNYCLGSKDTSMIGNHAMESNNTNSTNVESNSVESQEVIKKSSRKWRSQWTLLHPWAYLSKSMINEERIKCSFCEDAKKVNIYTQKGSSSIMVSALRDHASTSDHKDAVCMLNARKRMDDFGKGPLEEGVENMMCLLDMTHGHSFHETSGGLGACPLYFLEKYPSHCRLLRDLGMPSMPGLDEYGSYINAVLGREMLLVIRDYVKMQLMSELRASPFYSLLINESTNPTIHKRLIIYILYITTWGKGHVKCDFVELLAVENGTVKCIYDVVTKFLSDNMLDMHKLIAIATNGASVMIMHKTDLVVRFQESMPYIMGVHCIAHRQALATKDGFVTHPHVYAFVDKVANKVYSWLRKSSKRHDELWKIKSEYDMLDVKALQIHSVRWLSRGQVMERLVNMMLGILQQREQKLNKLNMEFQWHEMDVTSISAMLELTIEKLKRRYLDYNGSLDECISMAKVYVTNILDSLNKHFEDIYVYNAFEVFSPSSYPPDAYDREKMTLEDLVGMLYQTAQHKSMHDSWRSCSVIKSRWDTYPEMMRLWQVSLVIPASTSSCERGFSRQNFIKNMCRSSLGLDTLDALMLLSIDARGSLSIDSKIVFDMWMNAKRRRAMPLE
ncbi:hypothetical protein KP509_04G046700 [Ceratopteris richardii]|uniref:Transposase n=1 Tax=Ceratopteris richardii TaxID=49495 RepID=A0A8T2V063_CERRI|nr:hypothetical protein KP509_04G046700 [Ceratopteris richardii]